MILDRIQQLKGEQKIEDLKVTIQDVPEDSVRRDLEKQLNDLKAEAAKFSQQAKEVEQARMQEQLNAEEKLHRLEEEISERKARTWQSYFRRELIATIIGSILLLMLAITLLTAMFRQIQTTEIINNAFLIILGYFFGQSASRTVKIMLIRFLSLMKGLVANTACTRLVGICAFSGSLRSLELGPPKWRSRVPPTSG